MSVQAFRPLFVDSSTGSSELDTFGFALDQPLLESPWLPAGSTMALSADDGSFVAWSASGNSVSSRVLLVSQFRAQGQSIADLYAANATISKVQIRLTGLLQAKSQDDTQISIEAGIGVNGGIKTPPYDPPGAPPPVPAFSQADAVLTSGVSDVPFDFTIDASAGSLAGLTAQNALAMLRHPDCYVAVVFTNDFAVPFDLYVDTVEIIITQTGATSNLNLQPINRRDRNTRPLGFARSVR